MKLDIIVHTDWRTLVPLEQTWRAWTGTRWMSDPDWLGPWWQAYSRRAPRGVEPHRSLAVLTIHDAQNDLLGIAPFYIASNFANRRICLLGDGLVASDYVGLVAREHDVETVARAAARWCASSACRRQFGAIDVIEWQGQQEADGSPFWEELKQCGWRTIFEERDAAWQIPLPDNWEAYLAQLSHSQRRKVRKVTKFVEQGSVHVECVASASRCEAWWPHLVALHQRRRNELGQPGCFADPRFGSFLRQAVARFMARGEAYLLGASVDDTPIACGLFFARDGHFSLYQCGMDSRFKHFEPGHLINTFAMKMAIERGMRVFDFLRGDEPYKRLWQAQPVPLFRCRAISPQWPSRLKHSAWCAARQVKRAVQLVRSLLPAQGESNHVSRAHHLVAE